MKVRIEIDTKTFVRFWLVVIGFAFAILALYSARMPLFIIGTALFLALALNGPVSWMARRLPDRSRTLSTAIAFYGGDRHAGSSRVFGGATYRPTDSKVH